MGSRQEVLNGRGASPCRAGHPKGIALRGKQNEKERQGATGSLVTPEKYGYARSEMNSGGAV